MAPSDTVAPTPAVAAVERVSALDLLQLASDAGAVPNQVGAVLVLDTSNGFDVERAAALLGERIERVPRLRQRLTRVPMGCGRPIWVDDPHFDLGRHVSVVAAPDVGDDEAVLEIAAARVTTPLPMSRPLWSATFVTDLSAGRVALVVVFHHVLADGLGGLAVLAHLLDAPVDEASSRDFPQAPPTRRHLRADAWRARLVALRRLPTALRGVRPAVRELGLARTRPAPRTSLNRPTGPRRRLATVHADLASIRDVAHTHGATVNDVVLTAVTGALQRLLLARDERLDEVVVSVLIAPSVAGGTGPGNRAGVMPVRLPTSGHPERRLRTVAAVTRTRKQSTRGASAALLAPLFRALAALGLLRWFIDHQRMVTTFVTNLAGPREAVSLAGHPVVGMQPVSLTTGNVTVAFAVLSYAGALTMTVAADPDHVGDLDELVAALRAEFRHLVPSM